MKAGGPEGRGWPRAGVGRKRDLVNSKHLQNAPSQQGLESGRWLEKGCSCGALGEEAGGGAWLLSSIV